MNIEATCRPLPGEANAHLLFLELAASGEEEHTRRPVHLALAIDASSSMGGPRLACAIEAARAVAERLGEEDVLSLIAFDHSVRVLFGPGKVDAAARAVVATALDQLRPGVGTALHEAVSRTHESLRRSYVRETRPHAIVLTDGFPSIGPTDPDSFRRLSRKAAEEGIATSAIGVGLDYDEECVGAIVEGGQGRYSFVDKPGDIPVALARHLAELFGIAVDNASVRVTPAATIREAVLLHRYPAKIGSDGLVIETGPIGRGSSRRLLFRLSSTGELSSVAATIGLTLKSGSNELHRILSVPANGEGAVAEEALREYWRLDLAERENEFWAAVRRGVRPPAQKAVEGARQALVQLASSETPASELAEDKKRIDDEEAVLDGRLTADAREAARKRSHHTGVSRVTGLRELGEPEKK